MRLGSITGAREEKMKELKEAVKTLMEEEYRRASEKFGENFHSPHEAYAVIKEEVEEAESDLKYFKTLLKYHWCDVKKNDMEHQNHTLEEIEKSAINAACECIQVAAMAYKARK